MTAQQVAKQKADTVKQLLTAMAPQLRAAMPKHLTVERLMRVTMTAINTTPKLLDCDRKSLLSAVMSCAQLGLEPDGVLGQAYLVPYGKVVQFIPGYKGYITLARNSGDVVSIAAHEVCEKDHFDYQFGLEEKLEHRPAEGERGDIKYFYAYATFKDGGHAYDVLTVDEVNTIRDQSQAFQAFTAKKIKSTPWASHYVQMGRKTAIRRLANYLPLSVQKLAAMEGAYDGGKTSKIDELGDLIIEGEAEEVTEEATEEAATGADTTETKLDKLADGDNKPAPGDSPATEQKSSPAEGKAEAEPEPEPEEPKAPAGASGLGQYDPDDAAFGA